MVMRILLPLCLLANLADAAWLRHVMTPKSEWFDTPAPHPLSYFTDYPMCATPVVISATYALPKRS